LNIIFAGTPALAVPLLEMLTQSEHKIVMVLTQPDRPAGRGRQLTASPIKTFALEKNLPVLQPEKLKGDEIFETLKALQPDLMIVMAYGLFVPEKFLTLPRLGCVNAHVSLLPRWRGAGPIARSILAGDKITGTTLMQMDMGWDTGAMLAKATVVIEKDETTETLSEKLAHLSAQLVKENLSAIEHQTIHAEIQNNDLANHAKKIEVEEALINWSDSAEYIDRAVRAFNPWPVAYTMINNERVRIWKVEVISEKTSVTPGTIINASKQGIDIATGEGICRILEVQFPGKKRQHVRDVLNAQNHPFKVGNNLI
jgi:methionyl-tRNA formyltransferase